MCHHGMSMIASHSTDISCFIVGWWLSLVSLATSGKLVLNCSGEPYRPYHNLENFKKVDIKGLNLSSYANTKGMTGFSATTRKPAFAVGSGCWRFATIAQTTPNRFKPF
ncbi:hypothetical protein DY000_02026315 [Brassica cretica]|uniref:Malectin-like domain-containing protein n=1 Tax=Brassica cretica TaxID=69181 RepID=A0ABQ7EAS8_BRACR|nr:hypothetical protein DY000_02026315 [Brassica cretica]